MGSEMCIRDRAEVTVFILESPRIADILIKKIGRKIGNTTLKKVASGKQVPNEHFDVIYIGNPLKAEQALAYSSNSRAMSIYPDSDKMSVRGTLGIGIKSGKPIFLLNLKMSKMEGLVWDPAIISVAKKL